MKRRKPQSAPAIGHVRRRFEREVIAPIDRTLAKCDEARAFLARVADYTGPIAASSRPL